MKNESVVVTSFEPLRGTVYVYATFRIGQHNPLPSPGEWIYDVCLTFGNEVDPEAPMAPAGACPMWIDQRGQVAR